MKELSHQGLAPTQEDLIDLSFQRALSFFPATMGRNQSNPDGVPVNRISHFLGRNKDILIPFGLLSNDKAVSVGVTDETAD
jgi:hypothetical protein